MRPDRRRASGIFRAAGAVGVAICVVVGLSLASEAINSVGLSEAVKDIAGPSPRSAVLLFILGTIAGCLLFPMSAFAIVCGIVLGAPAGIAITVAVAASTATLQQQIGRAALAHRRLGHLDNLIDRLNPLIRNYGLMTVLTVRLTPLMPFALSNYAMGALELRARHMFAGTAIAVVPRTVLLVAVSSGLLVSSGPLSAPDLVLGGVPALLGLVLAGAATRAVASTGEPQDPPSNGAPQRD